MSDRDYNSPEYDRPNYETAEEYNKARREREAEMAENGQNPYGANYSNYSNYSNYDNGAASGRVYSGSTMTDATGKPLKNYFALKLTLSIMMIMGCCCSNFFLVIVGVIALVFTCMANNAYNQGNAQDFQRKSKISTILLWMGGIVMAVMLMFGIVFMVMASREFEDVTGENIWDILENEDLLDDPDFWEDLFEDFEDYEGVGDAETDMQFFGEREVPLPEGYEQFVWENTTFSVPMSYDKFIETGFVIEDFYDKTDIEPGDLEYYSFQMDNGYYGSICFSNYSDETRKVTDCTIDYLYFYNDEYNPIDITFFNGLKWGSSLEDVKTFLGEPQYISTQTYEDGDVYQTVGWNYSEGGMSQGVTVSFDNNKMYSVALEWFDK